MSQLREMSHIFPIKKTKKLREMSHELREMSHELKYRVSRRGDVKFIYAQCYPNIWSARKPCPYDLKF